MQEVRVLMGRQITAVVAILSLLVIAIASMFTGAGEGSVQAAIAGIAGLAGLVVGESRGASRAGPGDTTSTEDASRG